MRPDGSVRTAVIARNLRLAGAPEGVAERLNVGW